MLKLIAMTGPAGSGKDTAADYLVERYSFQRLAFAGGLKTMLASVGLAEPEDRALKEQLVPGYLFTWRQAAQALGTEWGRGLDPDIWTKITRKRIEDINSKRGDCRIVLTDCRFENEATMVRALGGQVWHMFGRKADLGAAAAHASEAGVRPQPGYDRHIVNNNSLEALHKLIDIQMGHFQ